MAKSGIFGKEKEKYGKIWKLDQSVKQAPRWPQLTYISNGCGHSYSRQTSGRCDIESFACCHPAKAPVGSLISRGNRRSVLLADKVEHCLLLFRTAKILTIRSIIAPFSPFLLTYGLFSKYPFKTDGSNLLPWGSHVTYLSNLVRLLRYCSPVLADFPTDQSVWADRRGR